MGKRRKHKAGPPQPELQAKQNELDEKIQPVYAQAVSFHQQGNLVEAAKLYQMILEHKPDHADALHYLGIIGYQNGGIDSALTLIKRAIEINGRNAEYHYNLATIYQAKQQTTLALKHYKKSVKLKPDYAMAYQNMAVVFHESEDIPAAKKANLDALKIEPDSAATLANLGALMNESGQYSRALEYYDKALSHYPMDAETQLKKSHLQLLTGEFKKGWHGYQWMLYADSFLEKNTPRLIPFPKWDGSSLQGKRLLINSDQGIGDELMFISCLTEVIKQAESVVLECDARLLPLYQRSFTNIDIIPVTEKQHFHWHKSYGDIDCRINLSGLAQYFRNSDQDFPKHNGYIKTDQIKLSQWSEKLAQLDENTKPLLNIGISWYGGNDARATQARSIPLQHWKNLSAIEGVRLISLQYGQHQQEVDSFNEHNRNSLHVFDELDPLQDLDGFSALIAALDLVISIDNSTVHFSGAIGTPTWVLLPHTPDWRWQLNRTDSPWYPASTLFRAEKFGFDSLRKQLNTCVKTLTTAFDINVLPGKNKTTSADVNSTVMTLTAKAAEQTNYALLLNDTSAWYHWGCSCTSLAIHKQLRERWESVISVPITETRTLLPFPQTLEQFDEDSFFDNFCNTNSDIVETIRQSTAIFINGEGTLHRLNQSTLGLLYLAYIANTRLNKKVNIINHSCYPDGPETDNQSLAYKIYQKVYQTLDYIAIREVISLEEVKKLQVSAVQSFDCLPLFIEDWYKNINDGTTEDKNADIIIAASVSWDDKIYKEINTLIELLHQHGFVVKLLVGASANIAGDDVRFIQAIKNSLSKSCELICAFSEQEWLQTISQAQLLISGRFHHTIAAAFLNTPFIVMESNTPKIKAILKMFSINSFVNPADNNLSERLYEKSLAIIENPESALLNKNTRQTILALTQNNFPWSGESEEEKV